VARLGGAAVSTQVETNPVTQLLLARLVGTRRGLDLTTLRRDLYGIANQHYEKLAWQHLVASCLEAMHRAAYVVASRSDVWRLTAAGTAHALVVLRWGQRPKRCSWGAVQKRLAEVLICEAPFVATPDHRTSAPAACSLVAGILRQTLALPVSAQATTTQLADAMLARALGLASSQPLTLTRLRTHVLQQELGRQHRMEAPLPKLIQTLAAKQIGASRAEPSQLQNAILQRYLRPAAAEPTGVAASLTASPATWQPTADFADHVREAARRAPPTGYFGTDKVFINHVFHSYCERYGEYYGETKAPDFATFQQALLTAYRKNELMLMYADLVEAMNPRDVAESRTLYLRQPLHFVCL